MLTFLITLLTLGAAQGRDGRLEQMVAAVLDTGRALKVHGKPKDLPRRIIVDFGSIASSATAAGMHVDTQLVKRSLSKRDIVGSDRTAVRCEGQSGPCYVKDNAVLVHFRSITVAKDSAVADVDYMTTDRRREHSAICTWRVRMIFLTTDGRLVLGQLIPLRRC